MIIGVDTSVIVAGVHANHPLHGAIVHWLNAAFEDHEVVVAHHSLLEAYAVLTRLPAAYRLTPAETGVGLVGTLRDNARIAPFDGASMWGSLERITGIPASGGGAYDAFVIDVLAAAGVEAIATSNVAEFRRLTSAMRIIDPLG